MQGARLGGSGNGVQPKPRIRERRGGGGLWRTAPALSDVTAHCTPGRVRTVQDGGGGWWPTSSSENLSTLYESTPKWPTLPANNSNAHNRSIVIVARPPRPHSRGPTPVTLLRSHVFPLMNPRYRFPGFKGV